MELSPENAHAFRLDTADSAFAQDPYPVYRTLRDHAPVCQQPDGSFFISRYEDVHHVMSDPELYSSDKRVDFRPKFGDTPLYEHHTTSIVFNDPPYHTRVRKLLAPFFAARVLRQMESSIGTMVDRLLDRAEQQGTIDVVSDYALVIPLNLIGDLLGVPYGEREPLRLWAQQILGALEPINSEHQLEAGNQAVIQFKEYLVDLIKRKRAKPPRDGDMDVLWALIQASESGEADRLSELEILHNAIFMLNAGHDTTGSLIANGVDLLCRYPEQRQRLLDNPALIKPAVEEMLRFESPLQIGNRKTTADTELGGVPIAAGTFLHLGIGSANHDERQFDDAHRFDVARQPNRHLAFAHGIHTCAGNSVARIEAQIAFSKLLERFPNFCRGGPTQRPNRWRFRVVERLEVDLEG